MNCSLLITLGLLASLFESSAFLLDTFHYVFGLGCSSDNDCRSHQCNIQLQPKCENRSCTCAKVPLTTTKLPISSLTGTRVCQSQSDCSDYKCDDPSVRVDCLSTDNSDQSKPRICCCTGLHIPFFTKAECSKTIFPTLINSEPDLCTGTARKATEKRVPSIKSCSVQKDCDSFTCAKNLTIRCLQNHLLIIPLPGKSCWCVNSTTGVWDLSTWPVAKSVRPSCTTSSLVTKITTTQAGRTQTKITKSTTTEALSSKQKITTLEASTTGSSAFLCYQCGYNSTPCSARELFDKEMKPTACSATEQYCMTDVYNRDGNLFVFKRCADEPSCKTDWLMQSSHKDKCIRFNEASFGSEPFTCHFCCSGQGCNSNIVPPNNSSMYIG